MDLNITDTEFGIALRSWVSDHYPELSKWGFIPKDRWTFLENDLLSKFKKEIK